MRASVVKGRQREGNIKKGMLVSLCLPFCQHKKEVEKHEENLPAQKETESKGAWLQKENENC